MKNHPVDPPALVGRVGVVRAAVMEAHAQLEPGKERVDDRDKRVEDGLVLGVLHHAHARSACRLPLCKQAGSASTGTDAASGGGLPTSFSMPAMFDKSVFTTWRASSSTSGRVFTAYSTPAGMYLAASTASLHMSCASV